jgi:putative FmdB family regulatory protein
LTLPIYGYRCKKCGVEEDHIHPMTAAPATHHHAGCGGVMQKTIPRCGVRFVTDRNSGSTWSDGGYSSNQQDWIAGEDGSRSYFTRPNKKTEKAII